MRPDLLVSPAGHTHTVIDFKTTSCADFPHFLASAEQYDYDRQAALYFDVLQATRFLIIGVQKRNPHHIWVFDATAAPGFIEWGRRKHTTLLRRYATRQVPPVKYYEPQFDTKTPRCYHQRGVLVSRVPSISGF